MTTRKPRAVKAWGIVVGPDLEMPCLWRIHENKRLLVEDFVRGCQALRSEPPYTPTWDDLRKEGYKVVRILITVLPTKRRKK